MLTLLFLKSCSLQPFPILIKRIKSFGNHLMMVIFPLKMLICSMLHHRKILVGQKPFGTLLYLLLNRFCYGSCSLTSCLLMTILLEEVVSSLLFAIFVVCTRKLLPICSFLVLLLLKYGRGLLAPSISTATLLLCWTF